ncbi:hypothetical protein ACWC9H_07875 [Streptomyces sp. NPDC001251]
MTILVVFAAVGCSGTADSKPAADGKPSPSVSASRSVTGGAQGAPGDVKQLPGMPTVSVARAQLAGLKVAAAGSMAGYSREKFPHWASQGAK